MGEAARKRKLAALQCPQCHGTLRVYTDACFAGLPLTKPCPVCTQTVPAEQAPGKAEP